MLIPPPSPDWRRPAHLPPGPSQELAELVDVDTLLRSPAEPPPLSPPPLSAPPLSAPPLSSPHQLSLTPKVVARLRTGVNHELTQQRADDKNLITSQTRRLQRIDAKREKLLDAYLDGALPKPTFKKRQDALDQEQREAEHLLSLTQYNTQLVEERLDDPPWVSWRLGFQVVRALMLSSL
jgi:hypothetical protein